ncbi:MAG: hypothetical protein KJO34_11465, partial [Deltaproteobacteria bacterium]|nr:hypothetical protein [Deltaproteobacteria bacterium]
LKKMDIATGADIKALKKEIRLLKKANSNASTPKRTRSTTARKSTTTGTKKRVARTATPKRTAVGVKKSTTTAARSLQAPQAPKKEPAGQQKNRYTCTQYNSVMGLSVCNFSFTATI